MHCNMQFTKTKQNNLHKIGEHIHHKSLHFLPWLSSLGRGCSVGLAATALCATDCWFGRSLCCIVVLSWQLLSSFANRCHERRHLSQQHLLCNSLLWSWLMDCGVLWTSVPHCHTSHSECHAYLIPTLPLGVVITCPLAAKRLYAV